MTKSSKDMLSPVFLYGDPTLSKDIILKAKRIYGDGTWMTLPAKEDADADIISAEISSLTLDETQKILIVNNLANRKNMREFLISIAKSQSETKLIIWDSENVVKIDPKNNVITNAAWRQFVKEFDSFGKTVNSGAELTHKQNDYGVKYVKEGFKARGKAIDDHTAELFVKLVGLDRGLLNSEMDKLVLAAQHDIDYQFVLDHTFATSKEAVLYVLSNALDKESVEDCICLVEEFINNGINENVIAEILVNKARWQLVVSDLFRKGVSFSSIPNHLMKMGTFPSNGSDSDEKIDTLVSGVEFLCTERAMPKKYFSDSLKKADGKTKMKKGSRLPTPFAAYDTEKFVRLNILESVPDMDAEGLLNRALNVYLRMQEGLFRIRMGKSVKEQIYSMIKDLKDPYYR